MIGTLKTSTFETSGIDWASAYATARRIQNDRRELVNERKGKRVFEFKPAILQLADALIELIQRTQYSYEQIERVMGPPELRPRKMRAEDIGA
jgi:hypothetical protein